jgi:hypothetical protein
MWGLFVVWSLVATEKINKSRIQGNPIFDLGLFILFNLLVQKY